MFGTLVIFFFQLHGTMFSVACTVLLYTWHGAFKNQERTAVVHLVGLTHFIMKAHGHSAVFMLTTMCQ